MPFPTSWEQLQPSCMGLQYHSSPQEYASLSTNNNTNTLDVQCYSSPQDSLSTNNNPLDYISNRLLQDYDQLHDALPIEGYSTLAQWIALGAQNHSNNIERSNIDWLNQASNYEYKEPLINSSSTISSTILSAPPHIDQFSNYNSFCNNQALANYINDSPPLILSNLLHNKPLEIEPKPLDLHLIEQELAMYNHNVGASTQFINEEMPNLKCLAQDQMNTSSLLMCDGAPSLMKQSGNIAESTNIINAPSSICIAESNNIINAPSSICRSSITNSCIAHKYSASILSNLVPNEERGNAVVKREERENGDEIDNALSSCNMFGYSRMMLNCNTPIQLGGVRRESTVKKRCREEGALCREESVVGKRENVGRKRGRQNYVCKRRVAGGGNFEEEEEEVILVRARRGQATDSHSLAERVRRERISQRMKLLQDLVPSCTKVLGKAAVLEEIINYVKSLQQQIEFLSMRLATTDYQKRFQI